MPAFLYHGSQTLVRRLEPSSARANGKDPNAPPLVYASPEWTYAAAFGVPIGPDSGGGISWSLEFETHDPRITIHRGVLDTTRQGYLYRVPARTFVPLDALQWVSRVPVVPHDYERVDPSKCAHWIVSAPRPVGSSRPRDVNFAGIRRRVIAQFLLGSKSIHGPTHWRRVARDGVRLAAHTGADLDVVRLFALLHDCRRMNELTDPGHGRRGAEFAATLRDRFAGLGEDAFERLRIACAFHTEGSRHSDATIGTCWDADRLDLPRVGVLPDWRFMSTDIGREEAKRLSAVLRRKSQRTVPNWLSDYGGL